MSASPGEHVSIIMSAEMAEQHKPQPIERLAGPGIWCTCGVQMFAPTEGDLAAMWREHLIHAMGIVTR